MLFLVLCCFVLWTYPKLCYGSSPGTYDDRFYQKDYRPEVVNWYGGKRILAPDTPYVAAVKSNQLYFIDKKFSPASAAYIKEQLEHTNPIEPHEYFYIDEVDATAEVRDSRTHETKFKFNPAYARVLYADRINRMNPTLDLPVHEPAGEWLVTYEIGGGRLDRRGVCSNYGCEDNSDCLLSSGGLCSECSPGRIDNECVLGNQNAIGACHISGCIEAVDTPKNDAEKDSDYYKRMDLLHWQPSHSE